MTITEAQRQQKARELDACVDCGGQLAVIIGALRRGTLPGEIVEHDPGTGRLAEKDMEQGPGGKPTDRARRGCYIGCGSCRRPVPLDHKRQLDLDAQWLAHDTKAQAAKARAEKAPRLPVPEYQQVNPVAKLETHIDALRVRLEKLEARPDAEALLVEVQALRAERGELLEALAGLRDEVASLKRRR